MATFHKFDSFVEAVAEKVHNLGSDVLKVMLTNVAPIAANTVKANLTEIAAGNGYTAGGTQATQSSSAQTSGTYKLVLNDVTFTCITAAMAACQYAVLYNDTAAGKELIGWWDYGASFAQNVGEAFTVDMDAVNGVLTLA